MNNDYQSRIDKIISYIKENSHQRLSLDQLASIANFSKYHFTRVFAAHVGMTPMAFVNQERLQKAIHLLEQTDHTILDISSLCGFESISTFNAVFKKHYENTPSAVRSKLRDTIQHTNREDRNLSANHSNKQEELFFSPDYNRSRRNPLLQRAWENMIVIKEIPEVEVAYVRHVGSYLDTRSAWDKLSNWMREQGLAARELSFIGVSLDDGNEVEEYACRYDACVTLPPGFTKQEHKDISYGTLPGGRFAVYSYYDTIPNFVLAYETMFRLWLPSSGYEADDRPCLELCLNDPKQDKEGKCRVDLHIPIRNRA
ncbi:AraC family transcriptional regulator [Paenibacillus sp. E194]|uniref:AraC family transcriptional regulator n=1 Tax=Paenibacillus sp. E194 TaxID=1458845 RepID=UPI0005CA8DAC|nr:AraC family transcriptional regulator [Paenibacillus sp. E194]